MFAHNGYWLHPANCQLFSVHVTQSEHFRRVNLPRIALSRFVGCFISHFDVPASGKSCRICLF
ncbi:hypothetical protein CLI80_07505 [Porphyromonas gingivalis]|nr:hypothetical protein CLI80_07505 [Porphyromonas gingivalis]